MFCLILQNKEPDFAHINKNWLRPLKGIRACLKNHSHNLHAPLCGIFYPNSVAVARYGALIRAKSPTNCDAHLAESLFQTRSRTFFKHALESILKCAEWRFIMKRGWLLLIVLLCVAFLISCGKKTEPDETKGELVKSEREADLGRASLFLFLFCSYFEKKKIIFVKMH